MQQPTYAAESIRIESMQQPVESTRIESMQLPTYTTKLTPIELMQNQLKPMMKLSVINQ
jgi:hypothetical protein